jgi:hypothetical protein
VRYVAYGLRVAAGFPIPRLLPGDTTAPPDLTIRLATEDAAGFPSRTLDEPWYASPWADDDARVVILRAADGRYRMRFADGTECLVAADGSDVAAVPGPAATLDDLAVYLSGPLMGFVLRLRGRIALHASAVAVQDGAVMFVGESGAGKSTLAALLALQGWPVVTEDIAVLDLGGPRPAVLPGHPNVGLWPDMVKPLFGAADALPPLAEGWAKRGFDLLRAGRFANQCLPLARVYLLTEAARASGPVVRNVPPAAATMRLLAHVYGNLILHDRLRVAELDAAQAVIASVPVREFGRGAAPLDPARVLAALAADLSSEAPSAPEADVQHR